MGKHTDQTRSGHSIKFPTKWWRNSWLIVVVVLLALIVGASYLLTRDRDSEYFFEVGTYTLDETEYNTLKSHAKLFFIDNNFDEFLLNYVAEIEAAKKVGISVTSQEIIDADEEAFGYFDGYDDTTNYIGNKWRQLDSERRALLNKLEKEQGGVFTGAVLYFSFDRYLYEAVDLYEEFDDETLVGDADAIEADRLYALSLAEQFVETLAEGVTKEKLQEIVDDANGDTRTSEADQSKLFGYDLDRTKLVDFGSGWTDEVQNPEAISAIRSANLIGVGEIVTIQGLESLDEENSPLTDVGYVVYYVDQIITPSNTRLQKDFEKVRADFGWVEVVEL